MKKFGNIDVLVLSTVNAPYRVKLDAAALVGYLNEPATMRSAAGPMSSFFYDVVVELQREFARAHGIAPEKLEEAARQFDAWSGMTWPGHRSE
ncbi:hypothetical protein [Rhizobium sp.]